MEAILYEDDDEPELFLQHVDHDTLSPSKLSIDQEVSFTMEGAVNETIDGRLNENIE